MKNSSKQHYANMTEERVTIKIYKIDDYGYVPNKR